MAPDTFFLASVSYIPEKRQVVADFSGSGGKVSRKYSFFPKMFFPLKGISRESFREALSFHDLKRVKTDFSGGVATVFGATFADLKKVNNALEKFFGFSANLVEPERQFLIGKNWSYFDCFSLDGSEIIKEKRFDFPEAGAGFFSGSLKENVSSLMKVNRPLALDITERIALSSILKIPLIESEQRKDAAEIFLENVLFETGAPLSRRSSSVKKNFHAPRNAVEIDFSAALSGLCAAPSNNLGFESVNCPCCAPSSLDGENVLPSTLVEVRFLREGLYFNPFSKSWAEKFHNSRPLRGEREGRKKEYFYDFFPAGPFRRNSTDSIMLADALALEKEGFAEILRPARLEWHCTASRSVLSKNVDFLKDSIVLLDSLIKNESSAVVASKGLFFSQALESSPQFFYRALLKKTMLSIMASLPRLLSSPESRFYSESLASAVECIASGMLCDFEEMALSEGSRVSLNAGFSTAVLDRAPKMSVLKRFEGSLKLEKGLLSLKNAF